MMASSRSGAAALLSGVARFSVVAWLLSYPLLLLTPASASTAAPRFSGCG